MTPKARLTCAVACAVLVASCGANSGGRDQESAPSDSPPLVTVGELLEDERLIGSRVRVTGTCIGYSRVLAVGPQPMTRSDWQLADGDVAIWVVGPYPQGCSGSAPAAAPGTYVAQVAADTVAALGAQPPRPRQYLIYAAER